MVLHGPRASYFLFGFSLEDWEISHTSFMTNSPTSLGHSEMTTVSIVTISFNQGEFLERTIRSVLDQSYSNIEYIVVDPGSKDHSREIIKRYESRIARTILEPDDGPAEGLNKGFSVATGDILGFLNADDVLCADAVSAAVRYLSRNADVDVVSGHAYVIGPDDRVLRRVYSDRMSVTRYAYGGVVLIQPSTFFRRAAYQRTAGFNTGNRATWDGELFLDMALAGCKFDRSREIWSEFRLHAQSITASKKLNRMANSTREEQFLRIMGRRRNRWDKRLEPAFRMWKHVTNPRDTMERILRGPVFGRNLS